MGCCFDCFKPQEEVNERTRLTDTSSRDPVSWNTSNAPLEIEAIVSPSKKRDNRGDNYYQRIIDDAHGKFLSANIRTRGRTSSNADHEAEKIRDTFLKTISGKEAPLSKSPPDHTIISRSSYTDHATNPSTFFNPSIKASITSPSAPHTPSASSNAAANIIASLSEPNALLGDMELVVDEIGEIVSRHACKIPVDDQGGSAATLVQFRPVTTK